MSAIVEAINVVTGNPASPPLTLSVGPGEIVGLLFPSRRPRTPTLRVLAGLDAPLAGEVRRPKRSRIVLAEPDRPLSDALASQPALVLIDSAAEVSDRNTWAMLASERAVGTSFLVATANIDQAYRSDRVSLASWEANDLGRAIHDIARRMSSEMQEFLAVIDEMQWRKALPLASELRRLNAAGRALVEEARERARSTAERLAAQTSREQLAAVSIADKVLDALIAEAQDR
jgi:hypothetical protein